jgi:hypothetical protein
VRTEKSRSAGNQDALSQQRAVQSSGR